MIKTMKRFGVIVTIFVIVFSTLTPLWGVKNADAEIYAISALFRPYDQSVFTDPIKNGGVVPDLYILSNSAASIKAGNSSKGTWQPTDTQMKFSVSLEFDKDDVSKAVDINKNGKFDADDNWGSWDAILDSNLGTSSENGLFIEVIEAPSKEFVLTPENPPLVQKLTGLKSASGYQVVPKSGEGSNFGIGSGSSFPYRSINISSLLWQNPDQFFEKSKIDNIQVAITNLKPDTKYYYRLHILEDKGTQEGFTSISESQSFKTLTAGAQNPNNEELGESTGGTGSDTSTEATENIVYGQKIGCSFGIVGESDWTGCFIRLYWNTLYTFSAWVLRGAAGLMDTFMAISLSSAMYKNSFLETGWTVVRDVCNIFFIFILLWTAFKMVINDHHFNANKTIVNVVIIGLLINFSLFFSRVIVDMGNISARVFYNQIRITGGDAQADQDAVAGAIATKDVKPKAISSALADGLSFGAINSGGYEKINKDKGLNYGTIFLLITLNIIVNLVAMWVFIKVAFAFLGRVLSLWVGMIMSPFAFTSTIVDGGGHGGGPLDIKKLGWTDWLRNMLEAAFYPALYLFFIFLIILLIQSNFAGAILVDVNTLDSTPFLIMTLFKFMFIIGLLMTSAEFAKKMSGTFGGGLTDFVGKAAGFLGGAAVGVATGGMAMAGSKILGARAAATLGGEKGNALRATATSSLDQLRANPANSGKTDAQLLKMQDKAKQKLLSLDKKANSSYDLRQTKIFGVNPMQGLSTATGLNFNAGVSGTRLGVDSTAGGYQAAKDRKAAKDNEKEEKFKKLLGDKTVNYNGVMMTQDEAQKKADEMKQDIADHEETKKNDPGIKNIEDELERIEKAIKDRKDAGLAPDPALVAQRQAERQNLADRKQVLNDGFKAEMIAKHGTYGVSPTNSIEKVSSELAKEARKAKDGYHKDYLRNKIFERQVEAGGLTDHHNNSTANLFRKQFWSTQNLARITAAMGAGAVAGGVVAGPLGAIVGTVTGAFGGGRLSTIQGILRSIDRRLNTDLSGARSYQAATHDISAGHVHAPHTHAEYHTPHGAWLDKLFNGGISIGGGSSGGGHGGGHDDHGHGGGGHH